MNNLISSEERYITIILGDDSEVVKSYVGDLEEMAPEFGIKIVQVTISNAFHLDPIPAPNIIVARNSCDKVKETIGIEATCIDLSRADVISPLYLLLEVDCGNIA